MQIVEIYGECECDSWACSGAGLRSGLGDRCVAWFGSVAGCSFDSANETMANVSVFAMLGSEDRPTQSRPLMCYLVR